MRSVRMMVGQVAARNALSDEAVAAVVERTGGVPLFVEELTRAVLESDGTKLVGREIPVTLHDSLMARLDRLGPGQGSRPGRRGNRRRIFVRIDPCSPFDSGKRPPGSAAQTD
jgi:hypothetical protein